MSVFVEIRMLIEQGDLVAAQQAIDSATRAELGPHERDQINLLLHPLKVAAAEAHAEELRVRRERRRAAREAAKAEASGDGEPPVLDVDEEDD